MSLRSVAAGARNRVRREYRYLRDKTISSRFTPRPEAAFATHMPILLGVVALARPRTVLELGTGHFSTPALLNQSYMASVEAVHSIEDDLEWAQRVKNLLNGHARLRLDHVNSVPEWLRETDLSPYDLIFVDDSKTIATRTRSLQAVCERARPDAIIVMHDFEVKSYQRNVGPGWRRFTFSAWRPQTGVLWRNCAALDQNKLGGLLADIKRHRETSPADLDAWSRLLR